MFVSFPVADLVLGRSHHHLLFNSIDDLIVGIAISSDVWDTIP
ncbi:hypothetical protein BTN49_2583 [Candidatus Enterovibrio escicola]|uniref:Uncharacterized protein n=1 Tax=Candidatus Enterovibrio escicola TaxID=1927127 RepID=A0A2A5T0S3_9GAMM|nr:hypothetical protein BTN49_2583 [Candidatus Enterovibrio escacola]